MQFDLQSNEYDKQKLKLAQDQYYMRDNEYRMANEILDTQKRIADLQKQIVEARANLGEGKTFEAEKQRLEQQIELEKELSRVRKEGIAIDEYRRTSFSEGWNQAFRQFGYDAENYSKVGAEAFGSIVSNMNATLDNFVRTGKLSFKSFAQSVIQDLIAIQLKAQAAMIFKSIGGAMGLGNIFSGTSSMLGFADGGEPPVGVASLVGERGPELFVPKRAGTIIPNDKLMKQDGGTTVVNNYNIQAIDTKSFEDRIMGSPNAIWAANQYANKSLAVNRGRT